MRSVIPALAAGISPSTAQSPARPPPSFLRPTVISVPTVISAPHRHSCAGRNPGDLPTPYTPQPPGGPPKLFPRRRQPLRRDGASRRAVGSCLRRNDGKGAREVGRRAQAWRAPRRDTRGERGYDGKEGAGISPSTAPSSARPPPSFLRPTVIPAPHRHSCAPPSFLRRQESRRPPNPLHTPTARRPAQAVPAPPPAAGGGMAHRGAR